MTDFVLLGLRIWLGLVMTAHGYHHARSLAGTARWFSSKGFRHPAAVARGSAWGEIAIGAALAAGVLTSLAAAGLVASMTVAYWSIHRRAGFFVFHRPDEGWEYVATLSVVATALAVLGPGRFSVDSVIGVALDGWWGLAAVAGGVLAAAGLLALAWRQPPESDG